MSDQINGRKQIIEEYKPDVIKLLRYLPWFQGKKAEEVAGYYEGNGAEKISVVVPVYDSTLLSFVKEAGQTKLMDRNYPYIYTRNSIRNHGDEIARIKAATYKDRDFVILKGIFSKYVMGGRTKASLWREAVEYPIFYEILIKLKELVDINEGPLV